MLRKFDVLIIGAGAAGLMCAIEAGKRGRRAAVLEHSNRPGKKILISGGGRCNFTNIYCRPENFLSANPHFAKSALARYTPADFIALVEKHHIRYHEKKLGQLFCDRAASDVTDMLDAECSASGIQVFVNQRTREVRRDLEFVVLTETDEFRAPALVVACGGLSVPKTGATAFGYDLARQFGLKIQKTRPGLVPFVLDEENRRRYCDLAGVSSEVLASFDSHSFREKMLITHKGLSGPAILQISSYWHPGRAIVLDLAPGAQVTTPILRGSHKRTPASLRLALQSVLPERFAARWIETNLPAGWTNAELQNWEDRLHSWRIIPAATEGYSKAEVTVGGVDTDELSAKSMESKKVSGLFFVGEVVDVTGQLGGFNFQWAWASGAAAGRAV